MNINIRKKNIYTQKYSLLINRRPQNNLPKYRGKWLIHGTKHQRDNQSQSLKQPFR